jgi:Na+/phosphate symporter
MISVGVKGDRPEVISRAKSEGDAITFSIKELRADHIERVSSQVTTPQHSLIYADILNAYRRAKDHALNIAEALAGEK